MDDGRKWHGRNARSLYKQILHKTIEQPARRRRLLFGLALFVAWRRYTEHVVSSAEEWGPRWLARLVAKAFSMLMDFNGARLVRVHPAPPLEPGRRHMVIWHPHAAYTTMALMHTATMTVRGAPLTWFTCVAPVLFTIPGLREALLLLNARSCDPKVVEGLASRGVAVGLQPGGVPEQLQADHTHEARGTPARPTAALSTAAFSATALAATAFPTAVTATPTASSARTATALATTLASTTLACTAASDLGTRTPGRPPYDTLHHHHP